MCSTTTVTAYPLNKACPNELAPQYLQGFDIPNFLVGNFLQCSISGIVTEHSVPKAVLGVCDTVPSSVVLGRECLVAVSRHSLFLL